MCWSFPRPSHSPLRAALPAFSRHKGIVPGFHEADQAILMPSEGATLLPRCPRRNGDHGAEGARGSS
jgi:hypothetical protein